MITDTQRNPSQDEGSRVFVLGSFVAACSVNVDRLPVAGETLAAADFLLEAGGKGLNVAIGLRRLGTAVDGLIAVGDDLFGTLAVAALAAADLPPAMLRRVAGRSGAGIGMIDRSGETVIAVFPGANQLLTAEHVTAAAASIAAAGHVVAQFEIGDAPIALAFAAVSPGTITILNPSPFRPILPAMLRRTSILIVNAAEASALAESLGLATIPSDAPIARWALLAAAVHLSGVGVLIITRGAIDAMLWRMGEPPLVQPSFTVTCVDGIGAGDAFLAGFVGALAAQEPEAEAMRRGAACGALATMQHGVAEALPTAREVAAFLGAAQW